MRSQNEGDPLYNNEESIFADWLIAKKMYRREKGISITSRKSHHCRKLSWCSSSSLLRLDLYVNKHDEVLIPVKKKECELAEELIKISGYPVQWVEAMDEVKIVGGVDISSSKTNSQFVVVSLALYSFPQLELLATHEEVVIIAEPYITDYLALRVAGLVAKVVRRFLDRNPDMRLDVLICDGNGRFHSRALKASKEVVEKAEKLIESVLTEENDGYVPFDLILPVTLKVVRIGGSKVPAFVSAGYGIERDLATEIVMKCARNRICEPIRMCGEKRHYANRCHKGMLDFLSNTVHLAEEQRKRDEKKKQGKWISFSGVANDQVAPSFSNGIKGKNNGWKSPKGNGRNSSDDEDKRPDNYIIPTRQEQMEMDKDFIDVIFCRVIDNDQFSSVSVYNGTYNYIFIVLDTSPDSEAVMIECESNGHFEVTP